ncbi:sulfatase family protein [Tichowtungia aerotolerans]|uniref:Sulfatase-like hydrolase/transferase n=1 Tax=Tichowtungia aerotolerans TaxID=2697043 RepID=A0A6P1M5H4_9BACT|nr:sulfatase-like hydrolase/transferase [Tichowtungia aerotolerans]QHI69091.1 sulfatase-like hydrolase/transferase [Tichowtungia aerotolerans]
MKHLITTSLCMISAGSALAAASPESHHSAQPNVIFFIADDMLPKHFNCLPEGKGKNLTPNIDRLAEEGIVMMEQYCASPVCTPSRYNVLTGRYASRATNPWFEQTTAGNGGQSVVEFNSHIMPDDVTLPKLLKKAGYETGMAGKNHVVEVSGLKRFPNFDASAKDPQNASKLKANHDRVCQAIREVGFDFADHVYDNNPDFLGLHDVAVQNMDWITEAGVEFLNRPRQKPFFLYLATTVPHGPTKEKRSWNANPLITAVGYLDKAPTVQPPRATIPERVKAAGLPVNDDTCNMLWLDDALGALIQTLEKNGLLDNTVIFFYSDHGQKSKGTLYEGGVHNPSIIWREGGWPAGSTSDALVHIVDFAPTMLDIAGANPEEADFDGKSFLPVLNGGQPDPDRILYFELGYARAIRKGNWKYLAVRYPDNLENMGPEERKALLDEWNAERTRKHLRIVTEDPSQPFSHLTAIPGGGDAERASTGSYPGYFDRDQLYDLSKDPREQNNLAGNPEYAAVLADMKAELEKMVEDLPGTFGEFGQ